jgi:hypothetical protein
MTRSSHRKSAPSPVRPLSSESLARVRGGSDETPPARQQTLATMVLMG